MDAEEQKRLYLAKIKAQGRSSPADRHWQDFYQFLLHHQQEHAGEKPPIPLILAASGASDRAKHDRLSRQLDWAIANNCFEAAIPEKFGWRSMEH